MATIYKQTLNNGHKHYTEWQNIKDLEAQKTTGPKSGETVWNYIATSVHLSNYICKSSIKLMPEVLFASTVKGWVLIYDNHMW